MTVKKLIKILQTLDGDLPVFYEEVNATLTRAEVAVKSTEYDDETEELIDCVVITRNESKRAKDERI